MARGSPFIAAAVAAAFVALMAPTRAHAQLQSRVTGLADVNYGTINAFVDQTNNQNVCVHSSFYFFIPLVARPYTVRATGSGDGGAFTLASGGRTLPYQVRWADAANQTTGTLLTAGVNATGFGNASNNQTCSGGENASLIITITGNALTTATAGSYTGNLSITIVPE